MKPQIQKIQHISKRLADIQRVFNGEMDALNVELMELLRKEGEHEHRKHHGSDSKSVGGERRSCVDSGVPD